LAVRATVPFALNAQKVVRRYIFQHVDEDGIYREKQKRYSLLAMLACDGFFLFNYQHDDSGHSIGM
jgi:hypothetical protein